MAYGVAANVIEFIPAFAGTTDIALLAGWPDLIANDPNDNRCSDQRKGSYARFEGSDRDREYYGGHVLALCLTLRRR
jgi:hypothetical protein